MRETAVQEDCVYETSTTPQFFEALIIMLYSTFILTNRSLMPIALLWTLVMIQPLHAQQLDKSELKFPEKILKNELVGYVLNDEGEPLEGVLVDAWSWHKGNETKTDSKGFFRLPRLGVDRKIEVRFSLENYSPHYIVQQQLGQTGFVVKLDNLTFIEGVVKDPNGNPVANALIQGDQGPNQADGVMIGHVRTETTTDKNGRYKLYTHPGKYDVKVSAPGIGVARFSEIELLKTEAEQLDVTLAKGVSFKAKVVDSVSGKPFQGLVLWHWQTKSFKAVSDVEGKIFLENLLPGQQEVDFGFGKPRKRGQFSFHAKGLIGRWWSPQAVNEYERKLIEPGGWQRNFDSMTFELKRDMDPVEIVIERGAVVTGHVFDPEGKPIQGATVAPAKTGSGNSITGDTRYSVKTKADGSYRVVLPASHDFRYNLIAHDGTYQKWRNWAAAVSVPFQTQPGQKVDNMDFKLKRPATIKGKLTGFGNLGNKKVRAMNTDMRDNRYYVPTTRSKKDGSFELEFVRPGETLVQVEPFWLDPNSAPGPSTQKVNIKEGQEVEGVELQLTPQN